MVGHCREGGQRQNRQQRGHLRRGKCLFEVGKTKGSLKRVREEIREGIGPEPR